MFHRPPAEHPLNTLPPPLARSKIAASTKKGTRLQIDFPDRGSSGSVARTEDASPEYPGIVESTKEYKFVERLIPPTRVPNPPNHDGPTPTGWKAPQDPPPDLPYMVRRSRMHNVPVYTDIIGGNREMTVVRKIEGDIWALEKDVKEHLTQTSGKTPLTQVNEITRTIRIKGYFDKELKTWLVDRGF